MGYGLIDLTGKRFCAWTVLRYVGKLSNGQSRWVCRCDCGTIRNVPSQRLRKGCVSCGCLNSVIIANLNSYREQSEYKKQAARKSMKQKWKTLDFRNAHFKATSEGSKKSWREDRDFRCRQIAEGRDGFTKLPREVREVVSALRKLKKGIRKKTYGEE